MTEPSEGQAPSPPAQPSRPKFVQCPKHGRVYDASKDTGCSQCQAEGTTADAPPATAAPLPPGKRGLPQWMLLAALLLLLAVLVIPQLLGRGGERAATPTAPDDTPSAAAVLGAGGDDDISRGRPRRNRFDPAQYEAPLRALEDALYEGANAEPFAAVGRVDGAARLLMAQILARNTRSPVAQDFMRAVERTLLQLNNSGEVGYVEPDYYSARGNWERIRREYFEDAPWFHAPMPLVDVGTGRTGAAIAARELPPAFHQISAFASDLERIIATYRATLMGFADATARTRTTGVTLPGDYTAFALQWSSEIDAAVRLGPRSWRANRDFTRLRDATGSLDRAVTILRGAAPSGRLLPRSDRAAALRRAEEAIQRARQALAADTASST